MAKDDTPSKPPKPVIPERILEEEASPFDEKAFNKAIDESRLRPLHWHIWLLSSGGVFLEGFNLFVIGVALPLIVHQQHPSPFLQGLIGSAAIAGTIFGAALMGRLADLWGRKPFYIANLSLVMVFSLLSGFAWNVYVLIPFQFLLGVGVGADYPICASYVSEFMPARLRGRMLLGTFAFQALGMVAAALCGLLVLTIYPSPESWHWMLALGAVPAGVVLFFRTKIPESPRWCLAHGQLEKAVRIVAQLVPERSDRIKQLLKKERKVLVKDAERALGYRELFRKKYIRRTVLASVPWFLMDIATYGVGIFTPTILAAMHLAKSGNFLRDDFVSTQGAAFLDLFLVLGFVLNVFLVERWGRIRLQLLGFGGMMIGLLMLAAGSIGHSCNVASWLPFSAHCTFRFDRTEDLALIFGGFILFNFLMNAGPNATTFILAAELFPTKLRASAHGFSAAFAKIGAVLGIVLLPVLVSAVGIPVTVLIISVAALLGFLVTVFFRVETRGVSLD